MKFSKLYRPDNLESSQSSFPIIEFMESLESHYADFSTSTEAVNICKISAKSPCHENP